MVFWVDHIHFHSFKRSPNTNTKRKRKKKKKITETRKCTTGGENTFRGKKLLQYHSTKRPTKHRDYFIWDLLSVLWTLKEIYAHMQIHWELSLQMFVFWHIFAALDFEFGFAGIGLYAMINDIQQEKRSYVDDLNISTILNRSHFWST